MGTPRSTYLCSTSLHRTRDARQQTARDVRPVAATLHSCLLNVRPHSTLRRARRCNTSSSSSLLITSTCRRWEPAGELRPRTRAAEASEPGALPSWGVRCGVPRPSRRHRHRLAVPEAANPSHAIHHRNRQGLQLHAWLKNEQTSLLARRVVNRADTAHCDACRPAIALFSAVRVAVWASHRSCVGCGDYICPWHHTGSYCPHFHSWHLNDASDAGPSNINTLK